VDDFIGESGLVAKFVSDKVQFWYCCLHKLSDVPASQP